MSETFYIFSTDNNQTGVFFQYLTTQWRTTQDTSLLKSYKSPYPKILLQEWAMSLQTEMPSLRCLLYRNYSWLYLLHTGWQFLISRVALLDTHGQLIIIVALFGTGRAKSRSLMIFCWLLSIIYCPHFTYIQVYGNVRCLQ